MDEFKEKFLSPFLPNSFEWEAQEESEEEEGSSSDFPLFDELDQEILMHREVHFSGSFGAMLEYYKNEDAKGIHDEIDVLRIAFLENVEKTYGKNLASILLSGSDAEKIATMRQLYRELQNLSQTSPNSPEGILADSILSEKPLESIIKDIPEILLHKPEILLPFVSSEQFSDLLAPGYGLAPLLAVELLGKARYKGAIKDLFLCIGKTQERVESAALSSLREIGEEAKQFGVKILKARPITQDNERAALLLTYFLPDKEIEDLFSTELSDPQVRGTLREYLSN